MAAQAAPTTTTTPAPAESPLDKVRDFFHDIRDFLHEKHQEATKSLSEKWQSLKEKLAERKEKRVAFVKTVLENIHNYNHETLENIMKILQPYREELGKLYHELEAKVNALLGRSTEEPVEDVTNGVDEEDKSLAQPRSHKDQGKSLAEMLEDMRDLLQEKADDLSHTLTEKWEALKKKLTEQREKRIQFVNKVLENFHTYSHQTLDQIMDFLKPFAEELDKLYDQLEAKMHEKFGKTE